MGVLERVGWGGVGGGLCEGISSSLFTVTQSQHTSRNTQPMGLMTTELCSQATDAHIEQTYFYREIQK